MANYVYNMVVCRAEVLEQYFIDSNPFGDNSPIDSPYITFNRLFSVRSLQDYHVQYGAYIYYGNGCSWKKRADGLYEIKFCTRWEYPIRAIIRAVELAHDTIWYAVEENHIYVSKFYWDEGVKEDVCLLDEDELDDWADKNIGHERDISDDDDEVWHYLSEVETVWRNWPSSDHYKRYLDVAAFRVELSFKNRFRGDE
jgi:hypothetical protein